MAVLDCAHSGGLTADVAAKLVPVLSTGVHDPHPRVHRPAWTIVDAPGDDADARLDSALRCAQLTENLAEIVDASAHLMTLATAP